MSLDPPDALPELDENIVVLERHRRVDLEVPSPRAHLEQPDWVAAGDHEEKEQQDILRLTGFDEPFDPFLIEQARVDFPC